MRTKTREKSRKRNREDDVPETADFLYKDAGATIARVHGDNHSIILGTTHGHYAPARRTPSKSVFIFTRNLFQVQKAFAFNNQKLL